MADVNIKIDIDADTSAIDRVRRKLRDLCREVDDCTGTMDKYSDSLRDMSGAQDEADRSNKRTGNGFTNTGKKAKGLLGFIRKLAMFGFKYLAIESLAALAVIGSAGVLFKTGQALAKGYQMALSGVAYAMTAIVAAGAAALAAMRQFQAVQFAPSFSAGAINTDDPMRAASAGMKMFIDDQQMAVLGTKGLTSAFKTLNDQQQITGKTTAVFRELSNYTAGMGGDMEKGSQSMAKFLAQFQKDKRMTEAVKEAGKELGPGFEKILKEANKLGLTTYEKFTEAALKGELGDTFKKYAGQLDAVNSTVIGQFKQGFSALKNILVEIGEPLLAPLTKEIPRVVNILKGLLLSIRSNVEAIGKGSLLEGMVNGFEKIALWIGKIVNRDIGKAGESINKIVDGWNTMMRVFEKIQDYLRPLIPAAEALGRILMDILRAFGGGLDARIQNLSDQLVNNEEKFKSFTNGLSSFMDGFSKFGSAISNVLIESLPAIGVLLNIFGRVLELLAALINGIMKIGEILGGMLGAITPDFLNLNKIVKALTASVIALGIAMMMIGKSKNPFSNFSTNKGKVGKFLKPGGGLDDLRLRGMYGKEALKKLPGKIGRGAANLGRGAMNVGRAAFSGGSSSLAAGGAAVAGSAVGGYYGGGFVADKLFNANTKMSRAGGALAGAGTGAAIGAGIGSVVPIVGTAAGAIIGGIAGAIGGFLSAGKERRKFDNIAKDILKNFSGSIDDAVKKGDTQALKEAAEKANMEYLELLEGGKYGVQAYNAKAKELADLNKQAKNAYDNFSAFEAIFGDPDKLNTELEKQGKSTDMVKNGIIDIFKVMRDGGHDVAATWRGVMSEFNQKLVAARLAMFQLPLQTIEMQEKVNAAQQRVLDGDTSEKSIISFLQDAFEYSMNLAQGDVTKATIHFQKTIEKVSGPGGSMNTVADKLMEQANKLNLFDPQVFADQLIATGQTEIQGRALAALTGGDAGLATLEINRRLQSGGAEEGDRINRLLQLGTAGHLNDDQIMMAMSGDSAMMESVLATGRMREAYAAPRSGNMHQTGVAAPNSNPVNVGGVTVNVAGFITDDKTAKRIAQMVQTEIARQRIRAGQ
jgi:hypothetical protein